MKAKYKLLRWGMTRDIKERLVWRTRLTITPTYRCNFNCGYCCVKDSDRKSQTHIKESTLDQWIDFFDLWPYRISTVAFRGGEPTLYKEFVPLSNYILNQGWHLLVLTNLSNVGPLLQVRPTYRFKIKATFHPSEWHIGRFQENRKALSDYNVQTVELGDYQMSGSFCKPFLAENLEDRIKEMRVKDSGLLVSPDRKIYETCGDVVFRKELWGDS